ncbi:MAG: hypothetical protein H0T46_33625, partial [Deltaproteobacteria bacterium]|nr:hypothetical protein [Deltaproteobacteria bacterium]
MIRLAILALVLGACGGAHLGPDTNVANRAAFAAQRDSDPAEKPAFSADDARATNAARRSTKGKAGGSTAPAPGSISQPASNGSSSGAW